MTSSARFATVFGSAGILMLSLAGVPAHAYPPGSKPVVFTNKYAYKEKHKVKAKALQVQAGCKVKFIYRGYSFEKVRKTTANKNGVAKTKIKKGPKRPGKYKVFIKTSGKGCATEKARVTFKVKRHN